MSNFGLFGGPHIFQGLVLSWCCCFHWLVVSCEKSGSRCLPLVAACLWVRGGLGKLVRGTCWGGGRTTVLWKEKNCSCVSDLCQGVGRNMTSSILPWGNLPAHCISSSFQDLKTPDHEDGCCRCVQHTGQWLHYKKNMRVAPNSSYQ